jgi:excisionase family DNA binding protein
VTDHYPDVLTVRQVAELLGMNDQMVRKAARERRLPAHRPEGQRSFVFFTGQVLEWLRAHPVETAGSD